MLTLVPFAITVTVPRSPMRTVTAVVGIVWALGNWLPPRSWLALNKFATTSAYRALGMSLLLLTVATLLARRRTRPAPLMKPVDDATPAPPRKLSETVPA